MMTDWSISGKTCLITGANRGIGYYTALNLLKRGARRVILACRNLSRANEAVEALRESIEAQCPPEALTVVHLNLASLTSVRQCAQQILSNEPQLHVLINNAGTSQTAPASERRHVTGDGFELAFQTNYLGHFLLTKLLLPLMQRSAPSRIVMVASDLYTLCWPHGLDIDDINLAQPGKYTAIHAYSQSKLALILFARRLNQHLADKNVSVFALHPGYDAAAIEQNVMLKTPIQELKQMVAERGAASIIYCVSEPGLESQFSGCYFGGQQQSSETGPAFQTMFQDDEKAERLWQFSATAVGENN